MTMNGQRQRGIVKSFGPTYGFILSEEVQEELFVHFSAIHLNGYKTLRPGQHVKFLRVDGKNGKPAAVDVWIVDERNS